MLEMPESSENEAFQRQIPKWNSSASSYLFSLLSVLFIHFSLFLLSLFSLASSFLILLPVAALLIFFVLGLGRCCKKIAGVRASAPAFVFFSIFFIWAVYIFVVRQVTSHLEDFLFNSEIFLLTIGLYRMMASDPGFLINHSSPSELIARNLVSEVETSGEVHRRVRYCQNCRKYVLGFDHHCPAFGNCVGQKNHILFLVLLVGFIVSEASYVACAFHFTAKTQTGNDSNEVGIEANISRNLVFSTLLFSLFQVVWQMIFLLWHIHCVLFNIKTDEWVNWKKYPEFQVKISPDSGLGESQNRVQFINPYDKGILRNLKEFLTPKG